MAELRNRHVDRVELHNMFVALTAARHACIAGRRVLRAELLGSDQKTHHCIYSGGFTCICKPRVSAGPIAREESADCMTNSRAGTQALKPPRQPPLPASYCVQTIRLPVMRSHATRQPANCTNLHRRAGLRIGFHAIFDGVNAIFLLWGVWR